MLLRIKRTDGKAGTYRQDIDRRSAVLLQRLDPNTIFRSGPIVIGTHNPFSVINPEEVCWVEVETTRETIKSLPKNVEQIHRLSDRDEYEHLLAQQWPLWKQYPKANLGDLLEAFVELSFRGGDALYLRVAGYLSDSSLIDAIFGLPAVTATYEPNGTLFINPRTIVRARVYHSSDKVTYPSGIWIAEADDI
jgi:hypothetical protein